MTSTSERMRFSFRHLFIKLNAMHIFHCNLFGAFREKWKFWPTFGQFWKIKEVNVCCYNDYNNSTYDRHHIISSVHFVFIVYDYFLHFLILIGFSRIINAFIKRTKNAFNLVDTQRQYKWNEHKKHIFIFKLFCYDDVNI